MSRTSVSYWFVVRFDIFYELMNVCEYGNMNRIVDIFSRTKERRGNTKAEHEQTGQRILEFHHLIKYIFAIVFVNNILAFC